ncbi:MAG: membrane protein insertase YidC [Rickettsiales bacterium]|jgi:YidC/Oxa1 family membrane protein insertase|nr:membrane protein insertase YidC [Rickettsiales bacterium]
MEDRKNLVIALILSVIIITSWNLFVEKPKYDEYLQQKAIYEAQNPTKIITNGAEETIIRAPKAIVKNSPRINFETPEIMGSINQDTGYFDELILKKYKVSKDSHEDIQLLNKKLEPDSYFVDFSYITKSNQNLNNAATWQTNDTSFASGSITLTKATKQFSFKRVITLEGKYLFKITDIITNISEQIQEVKHYGLINRGFSFDTQSFLILHEGPLAVIDGKLEEVTFKNLTKDKYDYKSVDGWTGFSDKYWLTAIVPSKAKSYNYHMYHYLKNDTDNRFQTELSSNWYEVNQNQTTEFEYLLFAGPKELSLLDKYSEKYQIPLFDRALDFGVLYFMTKPISQALHFINQFVHNFGVTIIIFTIFLRLLLFPLAAKSFREIYKMKQLQPQIKELKEKNKDNKMALNKDVMALYKRNSVKPMAGCVPLFIQIPIFFALYKVLFVTIEMRQADFFLWIHDLSVPDPTSIFNLFGLLPFEPIFTIGIWPCLMGLTMVLQQKFNPTPQDPMQETMMKILPYIFTFIFATFPAGLVVYWTFNNALSILQQYFINKRHGQ